MNLCFLTFCFRHSSAEIRKHFSGNHGLHHSRTNSNASATVWLTVVSFLLLKECFCFWSLVFCFIQQEIVTSSRFEMQAGLRKGM